jgi:dTDP-4-amino-4,6-dideoxygalactose transaminase
VFHWLVFPLLKVINILKPDSMMKHTGSRNQKMVDHLPEMWFERYTSFQAKVGLGLLSGVREGDSKRKKNVIFLKSKIVNMRAPMKLSNAQNVYWQFIVFFNNPTKVQSIMHKSGIDTSTTSLEIISSLSEYPCQLKTPNAKFLYDNGLFIPSFPGLSQKDLEHIANIVNEASKIDRNEKNCNHW